MSNCFSDCEFLSCQLCLFYDGILFFAATRDFMFCDEKLREQRNYSYPPDCRRPNPCAYVVITLINGAYTKDRTRLREYLQAGNIIREGDMRMISDPERLPALERKREGAHGLIIDSIEFQSAFFGALSNAQTIRKGKRKGKRRHPVGRWINEF